MSDVASLRSYSTCIPFDTTERSTNDTYHPSHQTRTSLRVSSVMTVHTIKFPTLLTILTVSSYSSYRDYREFVTVCRLSEHVVTSAGGRSWADPRGGRKGGGERSHARAQLAAEQTSNCQRIANTDPDNLEVSQIACVVSHIRCVIRFITISVAGFEIPAASRDSQELKFHSHAELASSPSRDQG